MALGTVDSDNDVTQIWKNVYTVVNDRISDPLGRSKWVYSSFPSESKKGTIYPAIIIDPANINGSETVWGQGKKYNANVRISVFHTHMATVDTIAGSIKSEFDSETIKGSLRPYNMYRPVITDVRTFDSVINGNIIHERRCNLNIYGDL